MDDFPMNNEKIEKEINSVNDGYLLDVDIDNFMKVNNDFGRSGGDFVLIEVPKRLKKVLESKKILSDVTRINADEFSIVLKNITEDEVKNLCETLINSMNSVIKYEDKEIPISISIGVTKFGIKNENVINDARDAMIQAKKNGRNQYSIK